MSNYEDKDFGPKEREFLMLFNISDDTIDLLNLKRFEIYSLVCAMRYCELHDINREHKKETGFYGIVFEGKDYILNLFMNIWRENNLVDIDIEQWFEDNWFSRDYSKSTENLTT